MASLLTCITTGLGWCFCSACTSLLGSCCGNDKPSTQAPGPTSGRRRSVFLLFLSILLSLAYQYGLAPMFVDNYTLNLVTNSYLEKTWLDGCTSQPELKNNADLRLNCAGNNGNYRVAAATTLFFLLAAIAAKLKPTSNREAWPAKIILYLFMVGITAVIPSDPWFSDIYLNIARIGGILFIVVQQLVIIDVASNWNDSWVEKANNAEVEEGTGAGNKWLTAILISCALLFLLAIIGLVILFVFFTGCTSNDTFIALTLVFCILLTIAQLSGEEGSLLASASISAWATFLCYSAVVKNPNEECNPKAGETDRLSVAFGIIVTIISLLWTGWSYTAENKLTLNPSNGAPASIENDNKQGTGKRVVTGVVTEQYGATKDDDNDDEIAAATPQKESNEEINVDANLLSNSWRLNIVLAAVSCWTAMTLTNWGGIQSDGTIANSIVGRTGMWMIMVSQWIVMTLYIWILIAPRVFPDRDFS